MLRKATIVVLAALAAGILGCAPQQPPREQELTVGLVQKEIRQGMSQAEVAEALGSPNIVTKDAEGHETWIYDKIATEATTRSSGMGGTILILSGSRSSSTSLSTQKTLTVVIKFDGEGKVTRFSYHASKF
jgi:outer membrane protein assembly factor BamE (lipoprotein component of BamABCDE complex)